jgi:2,4-dienoyl-CoA reductase-like NADH-dependent reductase (Old Yellow Enzyme family)
VLIKINSEDFIDGGLELEDSLKAAAELEAMGLDGVEVSGGVPFGDYSPSRTEVDAEEKEAYHRRASSVYKEKLSIPTAVVGGFRSPSVVEEVLANKEADLIAMARPFVREPDLAARWRSGDLEPAACISCNGCFKPIFAGEGIRCIVKEDES